MGQVLRFKIRSRDVALQGGKFRRDTKKCMRMGAIALRYSPFYRQASRQAVWVGGKRGVLRGIVKLH